MRRISIVALALSAAWSLAPQARAQAALSDHGKALVEGCLGAPSLSGAEAFATSVRASPWSKVRDDRELGERPATLMPDGGRPGESQRTRVKVTLHRGWDVPGPGNGRISYNEQETRTDWVLRSTGEATTPTRVSRERSCNFSASIANARSIFEFYLSRFSGAYGVLASPDGSTVDVFRFDPDRYDIELSIRLDKPVPSLRVASQSVGMSRLVLSDAPAGFMNQVHPSIPTVKLSQAELLAALDQPGSIHLGNMAIEPAEERLSELSDPHAGAPLVVGRAWP